LLSTRQLSETFLRGDSELKKTLVTVSELKIGMYVVQLDKNWLDTPFLLQGFLIEDETQIAQLVEHCECVYIDEEQPSAPEAARVTLLKPDEVKPQPVAKVKSKSKIIVNVAKYGRAKPASGKDIVRAAQTLKRVEFQLSNIGEELTKGKEVDLDSIDTVSVSLVRSAVRYPLALSWLALVQKKDNQLFDRTLRIATWALLCARTIGLEQEELRCLTAAILMLHVGYLAKINGKSDHDISLYKASRRSVAVMKKRGIHPNILGVIEGCFERFDGTGLPRKLSGEINPTTAQIAGLAIYYDLLLYPANNKIEPVTAMNASKLVYQRRGRQFQAELVDAFIEAIGIYPAGTILELNTNELAVTIDQPEKNKLAPWVMLVTDAQRVKLKHYRLIQLAKQDDDSAGMTRSIVRDLPPNGMDIDLVEVGSAYKKIAESRSGAAATNVAKSMAITKKISGLKWLISRFKISSKDDTTNI
jgi:HD-GYP domain-containing protein (c-di-GMP phosphodiesterase class II)